MPVRDIIQFLKEGVWRLSLKDLSSGKSALVKLLRIVLLAFKGFNEDKCVLRAQALTFYSLMSIVPLLAFGFGVAKGFGVEKTLETELRSYFEIQVQDTVNAGQGQVESASRAVGQALGAEGDDGTADERIEIIGEVVDKVIEFAKESLEQTKGGLIAGIGIIILLYTVFKLLQNIETSFNDIWGTPHSRTFSRKLSDYLSVLFLAPILFVISSGLTVTVRTQIENIIAVIDTKFPLMDSVTPWILVSLKALPFLVLWFLMTFLYMFMPNTRVRLKSGFTGGFVAGTLCVLWLNLYIVSQVGVAKYGAIYGSFAILPLFMIWLQMSWLLVLFGAEIAFAHQNVDTYEMEPLSEKVSSSLKKILALRIVNICVKNFIRGENPWSSAKIAETLELPVRLTNNLLTDLVNSHVLTETEGDDEKATYYQPARDASALSMHYVTNALEKLGNDDITYAESEEMEKIKKCYEKLDSAYSQSDANILLKDI